MLIHSFVVIFDSYCLCGGSFAKRETIISLTGFRFRFMADDVEIAFGFAGELTIIADLFVIITYFKKKLFMGNALPIKLTLVHQGGVSITAEPRRSASTIT